MQVADLTQKTSPRWLRWLAIALVVLGLILRFSQLDLRPYWYDETYTSLQISGYGDAEVRQAVTNQILTAQDLQKYQFPSPNKNSADTVRLLAEKEPQLTPLYFLLTRFWVQLWGDSIAVTRSFSALASALALPLVYWLCVELFQSTAIAWMAAALLAVSPFHLLYAQEARPPALWALTILMSHLLFLRAMRLKDPLSWVLYGVSGIVNLYTFLFSILLLAGHGAYVLLMERFRITRTLMAFSLTLGIAIASFVPWMMIFLPNIGKANQGSSPSLLAAPLSYIIRWIRNVALLFADFSVSEESPRLVLAAYLLLALGTTFIVLYGVYVLFRRTPPAISFFVLSAIALPFLPLVLKDLLSGGGASMVARYLVTSILGLQILTAYLMVEQMVPQASVPTGLQPTQPQRTGWQTLWLGFCLGLLLIGVVSSLAMTRSELWWNKAEANLDRQLAHQVINPANRPLILSDAYFAVALSLSHSLKPQVEFLLIPEGSVWRDPLPRDRDIFVFRPSEILLKGLQQRYTIEPVVLPAAYNPGGAPDEKRLWRLAAQ